MNQYTKTYLWASLLYLLLTLWLGWPVWGDFSGTLFGVQNDALGGIWAFWWMKHSLLELHQSPFQSFYLGAPFGINLLPILTNWNLFASVPITALVGPLGSHNFFTLLSFPLAGLAGFALAYHFLRSFWPSFVAGLIITLSPYHVTQSESFYHLAQIQWPIFYLLFLFKYSDEKNRGNLFWLGFFFVLTAFTVQYYAIFNVLATVIFYLIKSGRQIFQKKALLPMLFSLLVILFIVGLVFLVKKDLGKDFALDDLNKGGLKWWYLFLPSEHHPILGRLISSLRPGFSYSIQTIYVGAIPLVLGLLAVWQQRRLRPELHFPIRFFVVLALAALVLMIKPVILLGGLKIPTFSYLLYLVLPFVRILTRFSLLIEISLAMLAAFYLDFILKTKRQALKAGFLIIVIAMIFFEFLPARTTTVLAQTPDYYQELKNKPDVGSVVEYPFPAINPWVWSPMYWQTKHEKKLVGNYFQNPLDRKAPNFLAYIEDTSKPIFSRFLQLIGAKYILVHTQGRDSVVNFADNPLIRPLEQFSQASLFEVTPSFTEVYATRRLIKINSSVQEINGHMLQGLDSQWSDYVLAFGHQSGVGGQPTARVDFIETAEPEAIAWQKEKISGTEGYTNDFLHQRQTNKLTFKLKVDNPGKYLLEAAMLKDDGWAFLKYEIVGPAKTEQGGLHKEGEPGKKPVFDNIKIGEFDLPAGEISITFENILPDEKLLPLGSVMAQTSEEKEAQVKRGTPIAQIVPIYLYNGRSGIASLALTATKNFPNPAPTPKINFSKKNENHYQVQVENNSEPFFLVLLKSWSPGWQALVNGQPLEQKAHFQANGFANGWYIEKTGSYEIELRKN